MGRAGRYAAGGGRATCLAAYLLIAAGLASPTPVVAATMNSVRRPYLEAQQYRRAFWAAGPDRWAVTDPLPRFPSIRLISNPDGSLRDNRLVDALDWRRARDTSRFDQRYFRIAPVFQRQEAPATPAEVRQVLVTIALPRTASMQILVPPDSTTGSVLAQQNLSDSAEPTVVPEPGALTAGALLFGLAGAWWRSRRRA